MWLLSLRAVATFLAGRLVPTGRLAERTTVRGARLAPGIAPWVRRTSGSRCRVGVASGVLTGEKHDLTARKRSHDAGSEHQHELERADGEHSVGP